MRNTKSISEIQEISRHIRRKIINISHLKKASHIGTSLSIVDILAYIYSNILNISVSTVSSPDRDRLILSKGHGCLALYTVLEYFKFFSSSILDTYSDNGSPLMGHATKDCVPGVEASAGSLGHGLALSCGIALAGKHDKRQYKVYTILGDGECNEGTIWESALFASHHKLDNLTVIVDYNKLQGMGYVKDILNLEPFAKKFEAFGWAVREIDGHNLNEIDETFSSLPFNDGKPSLILAHTLKGKGVSYMEDNIDWHYKSPDENQIRQAFEELI